MQNSKSKIAIESLYDNDDSNGETRLGMQQQKMCVR